jgi:hypothetical protein
VNLPDVDVALHVLTVGTKGTLPPSCFSDADTLALLRGCTPMEAAQLTDALAILADLRRASPALRGRAGVPLNWPRVISRLTGWDERRAELAVALAQAVPGRRPSSRPPKAGKPARTGRQEPLFPGFDPPVPERRAPSDLSSLTRADVDAVHARAAKVDELAAVLRRAALPKRELTIARHLQRLAFPGSEVTWLELVVDACARHGALLVEVLSTRHHMGPVQLARDEAFDGIRRRSARSYQQIAGAFGCNHTTVSAGARRHEKRQREAAAAAPAPSSPRWIKPAPEETAAAAPASGPAKRTG